MADIALPSGIYQIINTVNGKRYIGSAVNLGKRWINHRVGLKNNCPWMRRREEVACG